MNDSLVTQLGLLNLEAERNVLATMKAGDMSVATELADKLAAADFVDPRNSVCFEALRNVLLRADPIDDLGIVGESIAVAERRKIDQSQYRVTAQWLSELYADLSVNIALEASLLQRLSWLRRLSEFSYWVVENIQRRPDPETFYSEAHEKWIDIAPKQRNSQFVYGWDTVGLHREVRKQRAHDRQNGHADRFDWPWDTWNDRIRPMRAGFLALLGAADGVGKSIYLEQIAEHWAGNDSHVVLVHLEDQLDYKLDRRLSRWARVPFDLIEDGRLDDDQMASVLHAEKRLEAKVADHLHYYHAPGETMIGILRELEARVREGVCEAIVFDYIDKVKPSREDAQLYGANIWERQAADMERLKAFAEKFGVPILTATQGNKQIHHGKSPTRDLIQGSMQKSQKSQLVILLHRDRVGKGGLVVDGERVANEGEHSPEISVTVDKQNRGRTGTFKQVVIGKHFMITDPVRPGGLDVPAHMR